MSYCVRILTVPGYPHSPRCFQETADAFEGALKDLGLWAEDGLPIVFGAHLLHGTLESNAILFNTEVCTSPWMVPGYCHILREHPVLDYAAENVAWLKERGVDATHCPIGYHRSLTRLTPQAPEIDVLFYGAITERRAPILEAVAATGLRCKFLTHDDDWSLRDYWLPRTKILLNVHAYPDAPLEMVRLSYCLANHVCVVSEESGPSMPGIYDDTVEGLPQACIDLCGDWDWMREGIATTGFNYFSLQLLQADILREVLG